MTRRSLAALLVLVLAVALPALTPAQTGAPLPMRIGYQTNADWLTIAARNLKLFEKAGLAPTYVKFQAGAPMIAAAESKSVDVTTPGTVPFIAGLAQGVDWVIIGIDTELPPAEGFVARADAGIKTMADLKGKTVGYFRASTSHYGLVMALSKSQVPLDQVKLLHMTPAQQVAAMINKNIDAAAVWEPWMQKMVHEANGRIIAMESDFGIDTALATYAVRRDWLRDNRETARRFLNALRMGFDALQKDSSGVIRSFAEEAGIKEEWARTVYKEAGPPRIYQWADPQYRYAIVKGSVFHKALTDLARFMHQEKIIQKSVDVGDVVDPTVVAEVLKAAR
jgi:aliphatic sulfonates family ABC transporter substrate-binding protein